jgi:hypothetical protein
MYTSICMTINTPAVFRILNPDPDFMNTDPSLVFGSVESEVINIQYSKFSNFVLMSKNLICPSSKKIRKHFERSNFINFLFVFLWGFIAFLKYLAPWCLIRPIFREKREAHCYKVYQFWNSTKTFQQNDYEDGLLKIRLRIIFSVYQALRTIFTIFVKIFAPSDRQWPKSNVYPDAAATYCLYICPQ